MIVQLGIRAITTLGFLGFVALCCLTLLYAIRSIARFQLITYIENRLRSRSYTLVFFLTLIATLSSLFLSEVAHFQPCVLCWYQRVMMYPQPILTYVGIARNEFVLKPYLLVLNCIGMVVALYHYSLHVLPKSLIPVLPCTTSYAGVPCDKGYTFFFGFMTFPLMAWVVFALNTYLLLISKDKKGKK